MIKVFKSILYLFISLCFIFNNVLAAPTNSLKSHKTKKFIPDATRERPILATSAIVNVCSNPTNPQIALIERGKFPFGLALPETYVEKGETTEQATKRTLRDDIITTANSLTLFGAYSNPGRDPRQNSINLTYITKTNDLPKAVGNTRKVYLISYQQLNNTIQSAKFAFDHKQILQDYIKTIQGKNPCSCNIQYSYGCQEDSTQYIREISDFSNVANLVDDHTLVLLDLDDTVFTSTTFYGSVPYFKKMVQDKMDSEQISYREAAVRVYPNWIRSQQEIEIKLTDYKLPLYLAQIRSKGGLVIGFTARQPSIHNVTTRQLDRLGIKFDLKEYNFSKYYKNHLRGYRFDNSEAKFVNGIMFCHDLNSKGTVFKDWFTWLQKQNNHKFNKIIFVDDRSTNLDSVRESVLDMGLEFLGLNFKVKHLFK